MSTLGGDRVQTPMVDIVLPAFNGATVIRKALDSAIAQDVPSRIFVVDDGSNDNSADIARSYGPTVTVVSQENRGVSGARNTGLRLGTAPFVALIDQDDAWYPDKLARQLKVMAEHPSVGIVFTDMRVVRVDGSVVEDGFLSVTESYAKIGRQPIGDAAYMLAEDLGQAVGRFNFIAPSTTLLRRSAIEMIGGFDESFRFIDDADCWLRLLNRWRGAVIEDRLVLSLAWEGCASNQWDKLILERIELGRKIARIPDHFPPGLAEYFEKWRATGLYQLGVGNLRTGNLREARKNLLASLLQRPRFGTALVLGSTFVPGTVRRRAQSLKRVMGIDLKPRAK